MLIFISTTFCFFPLILKILPHSNWQVVLHSIVFQQPLWVLYFSQAFLDTLSIFIMLFIVYKLLTPFIQLPMMHQINHILPFMALVINGQRRMPFCFLKLIYTFCPPTCFTLKSPSPLSWSTNLNVLDIYVYSGFYVSLYWWLV